LCVGGRAPVAAVFGAQWFEAIGVKHVTAPGQRAAAAIHNDWIWVSGSLCVRAQRANKRCSEVAHAEFEIAEMCLSHRVGSAVHVTTIAPACWRGAGRS
jgi:hypothetical protein